jgi:hypothetical protein
MTSNEDRPTRVQRRTTDNLPAFCKGGAQFRDLPSEDRGYHISFNAHNPDGSTRVDYEDIELIYNRAKNETHWYILRKEYNAWYTIQQAQLNDE